MLWVSCPWKSHFTFPISYFPLPISQIIFIYLLLLFNLNRLKGVRVFEKFFNLNSWLLWKANKWEWFNYFLFKNQEVNLLPFRLKRKWMIMKEGWRVPRGWCDMIETGDEKSSRENRKSREEWLKQFRTMLGSSEI